MKQQQITTLIVDDERHCIDRLRKLIADYDIDELNIAGECQSIEDAREAIGQLQPQLLFLDIQIGGDTIFELLKDLPLPRFRVIFTTAYEQYALTAFKFAAVDYLLKPIDPYELKSAVERVATYTPQTGQAGMMEQFQLLFGNLQAMQQRAERIAVPTITGLEMISVDQIIYCKSDVNYTTIVMKGKQKLMVAKTLKEFEALLSPYHFFRIHNSYVINLDMVKTYHKGKGGWVSMDDGTEIEVSSRRKEAFLQKLVR